MYAYTLFFPMHTDIKELQFFLVPGDHEVKGLVIRYFLFLFLLYCLCL